MKNKNNLVKIMVFGTFDGLHKGHENFFKQARSFAQSPYLIVSIARDKNVFKIKDKIPLLSEEERMSLVRRNKFVDKVVLSGLRNHIPHILKEKPDIICLGYDQKAYIKNLKKDLNSKGLYLKIHRLRPFKEDIYKNSLLKK